MAFSDWIETKEPFFQHFDAVHGNIGSLVGSRECLFEAAFAATSAGQALMMNLDGTFNRGFLAGRMRTLFRIEYSVAGTRNRWFVGFFFMCNDFDPIVNNASSDFYVAGFNPRTATDGRWLIGRVVNGGLGIMTIGPGDSDVIIDTSAETTVAQNDIYPIEVQWEYSPSKYGGTRIQFSVGNEGDTDYSNLSVLYDLVDTNPDINSSVVEGFCISKNFSTPGFSAGQDLFTFDETEIGELT
jgi:hypothetical protein